MPHEEVNMENEDFLHRTWDFNSLTLLWMGLGIIEMLSCHIAGRGFDSLNTTKKYFKEAEQESLYK